MNLIILATNSHLHTSVTNMERMTDLQSVTFVSLSDNIISK